MNATAMSPADTSRTVFSVRAGVKAALLWVLWSWVPQPVCSALDRRTKGLRVWLWGKENSARSSQNGRRLALDRNGCGHCSSARTC